MDDVYAALKVVADGSSQLVTWALALAAASVAAIVGSGYLQPSKAWRGIYLLFLPAWLFVGISVYFGNLLARRYMAAVLVRKENLPAIAQAMNTDFGKQQLMLSIALAFFAVWLICFLLWWIYEQRHD